MARQPGGGRRRPRRPDSFTSRGHAGGVCTVPLSQRRISVSPRHRAHDAYAGLAYARTLPYVDGRGVGIMGGSHGGTTTLTSLMAAERDTEPLAREKRAGFAAGVALYPRCVTGVGAYRPVAPVLILIGDEDDGRRPRRLGRQHPRGARILRSPPHREGRGSQVRRRRQA